MLLSCVSGISVQAQSLKRVVGQPVIDEFKIDGNVNLTTDELKAAMATSASHCKAWILCRVVKFGWIYKKVRLNQAELERDLLRARVLYWKRGWRNAQITPEITKLEEGRVSIALKVLITFSTGVPISKGW